MTALHITKTGHKATVALDGHDVGNGISVLQLEANARTGEWVLLLEVPILEGATLDVDEVKAVIPFETRELLKQLGWLPPIERGDA